MIVSSAKVWGTVPSALGMVGNVVRFTLKAVDVLRFREEEQRKRRQEMEAQGIQFFDLLPDEIPVQVNATTRYVVHRRDCWDISQSVSERRYSQQVWLEELDAYKSGVFRIKAPSFGVNVNKNDFEGVDVRLIVNLLPVDVLSRFPLLRECVYVQKENRRWRRATILGHGIDVDGVGLCLPELFIANPSNAPRVGTWRKLNDPLCVSARTTRPKTYGRACGVG